MTEQPAYLTDVGLAVSERYYWESVLKRLFEQAIRDEPSLTAAGVQPGWFRAVNRVAEMLPIRMPNSMRNMLMNSRRFQQALATVEPDLVASTIAKASATALYNEHVLNMLAEYRLPLKMWVTRHDDDVRPAHVAMEGTKIPLVQPFVMEGNLLQYPGDSMTAPIGLWANCRCCLVGRKR